MTKTHKDLEVWQRAISFVTMIYKVTAAFPKEELFGLSAQMRRSAISIPSNISEGAGRGSDAEFVRFLQIARSSAVELDTQFLIAKNIGYLNNEYDQYYNELVIILKMLSNLINKVKSRIP